MTPPDRDLYPLHEAQERLGGISRSLIYKLIWAGKLTPTHIGRRAFIAADELQRFIAVQREHGHHPPAAIQDDT